VRVSGFPGCTRVNSLSLWERVGVRVYLRLSLGHLGNDGRRHRRQRHRLRSGHGIHDLLRRPSVHRSARLSGSRRGRGSNLRGGSGGSLGEDGEEDAYLALVALGQVVPCALGDIGVVPELQLIEEEVDVGELLLQDFARTRSHGVAARGAAQAAEALLPAGRAVHGG
jgi:hypothetical protein